jgi:hypothetical protein
VADVGEEKSLGDGDVGGVLVVGGVARAFVEIPLPTNMGIVGDRYPPGPLKSKRPHERPKGPINHKVILSWAWGETTSRADRHKAGLM